jgi:tetratricopeptide (TPR) repeat protein
MGLEQYTESIRAFTEGLVLRPGDPTVRFRLGQSHWMQGNWEAVISAWEALLLDAPGHRSVEIVQRELPRAYYNDGLAKQSAGDYKSARRAYHHALSLDANYVSVLNNLAILDQLTGDLESSVDHFERVIEIKPEHRGARLGLAGIRLGQYRLDEAESLYEGVRSLDPADGQAVRGLAICALKRGQRQTALGWADKAGELWSPVDVLMFKAFVLEHNEDGERYGSGFDAEAVIAVYEEAIKRDSARADITYNLGVIHAKAKRWTDAVAQFDRSLAADSTYSAAKTAIAEVERILESEDTQILKLKRP